MRRRSRRRRGEICEGTRKQQRQQQWQQQCPGIRATVCNAHAPTYVRQTVVPGAGCRRHGANGGARGGCQRVPVGSLSAASGGGWERWLRRRGLQVDGVEVEEEEEAYSVHRGFPGSRQSTARDRGTRTSLGKESSSWTLFSSRTHIVTYVLYYRSVLLVLTLNITQGSRFSVIMKQDNKLDKSSSIFR